MFMFDPDRSGGSYDPVCLCLTQIAGVTGSQGPVCLLSTRPKLGPIYETI